MSAVIATAISTDVPVAEAFTGSAPAVPKIIPAIPVEVIANAEEASAEVKQPVEPVATTPPPVTSLHVKNFLSLRASNRSLLNYKIQPSEGNANERVCKLTFKVSDGFLDYTAGFEFKDAELSNAVAQLKDDNFDRNVLMMAIHYLRISGPSKGYTVDLQ